MMLFDKRGDGFWSLVPPPSVASKHASWLCFARQDSVFETLFGSFPERQGS
jgi:hypothetical protein